jgi:UDP-GlcNAc:undecaprenyl-phosphate GlcNAc-1-phosphate transferase
MEQPSLAVFAAAALCGAAFAVAVTPFVRQLALRLDVVDHPGDRRLHVVRTPTLGGVALTASALATLFVLQALSGSAALLLREHGWNLQALLLGTLVILVIGVADDARGLSASVKLLGQVTAGAIAIAGGYGFSAVTNPFTGGYWEFGWFGNVLSLLWIIGITNAFNLIDGLDGLATGVALIAAATISLIALLQGRPDTALLAFVLVGVLAGFLCHNFPPASIFLGDSGALLLGYTLSLLSIQGLQKGTTAIVTLVPILALGLPIMDMLVTMWRRFLVAGVSAVFRADQEHMHHRLVSMGLTHRRAVLLLYAVCLLFAAFAFLSLVARGPGNAVLVGIVAVASYLGIRRLGYKLSGAKP